MTSDRKLGCICLFWAVAVTFTLTSTEGKVLTKNTVSTANCYHKALPGYDEYYINTWAEIMKKCAPGTIFDQSLCTCVHGTPAKRVCNRVAIPGNETFYENTLTRQAEFCGPRHVFNESECMCSLDLRRACSRRFCLDFSKQAESKVSTCTHHGGGEGSFLVENYHGKFSSKTSIKFWTTSYRPFETEFQIQIAFKDEPSVLKNQVLLSNCRAVDGKNSPSVQVYLDRSKTNAKAQDLVRVLMRTTTKRQGVEVAAPYITGETNILVILKTKDNLALLVIQTNRRESFSSNPLDGEVLASSDYLRLGACSGYSNSFIGVINSFDYYPCWPRV